MTALESALEENKRLKEELESYKEDPAKIFYLQITEVVKTLAVDMKSILSGGFENRKLIKGDKEDRTFDQVKILLLDAETIFKGLKFARETVMPELKEALQKEESEVGLSTVDRIANNKKNK